MNLEITDRVVRFEQLEEKFGITIEALYARYEVVDDSPDGLRIARIFFDAVATNGELKETVKVRASAYNENHQLVGTGKEVLWKDRFPGFKSCEILVMNLPEPPTLVRLVPVLD